MRLTTEQLRALLDRYEAAETSLDEERALRAALAAPDLDPALVPYRRWFAGLAAVAAATAAERPGPWLEAAPVSASGRTAAGASPLRVVHRAPGLARGAWRARLAAAAMLVAVFAVGLGHWRTSAPVADPVAAAPAIDWSKYEVTDPAEASRITRAALVQTAQHLRRGSELTAGELARMEPIHLIVNTKKS